MDSERENEMRNFDLLALSKFDKSKKIRGDVEPGEYTIDVIVRLHGELRVGEDYDSEIVASIPWQKVAAVLFDKVNDVTIESVLSEALGDIDDSQIKDQADAAMLALTGSTEKTCKGKVTQNLIVELADPRAL